MAEDVSLSIPSNPKYLDIVRRVVEKVALTAGFSEIEASRVVLALDETCSNIIRHSCGGDTSLRLDIILTPSDSSLKIVVIDTGPCGKEFNPAETIDKAKAEEVTPGGFGVGLISKIMDSIEYDCSAEGGNRMTMVKNIS